MDIANLGLVSLFKLYNNLFALFNAKQYQYNLTLSRSDKKVNTLTRFIGSKVNLITQQEFELAN